MEKKTNVSQPEISFIFVLVDYLDVCHFEWNTKLCEHRVVERVWHGLHHIHLTMDIWIILKMCHLHTSFFSKCYLWFNFNFNFNWIFPCNVQVCKQFCDLNTWYLKVMFYRKNIVAKNLFCLPLKSAAEKYTHFKYMIIEEYPQGKSDFKIGMLKFNENAHAPRGFIVPMLRLNRERNERTVECTYNAQCCL